MYTNTHTHMDVLMSSIHHITSHHITSHHITSHHITSQHITPYQITPYDITPHHVTPHHVTSQDTRLNNRWLDLRVPSNNAIMRIKSGVSLLFRWASGLLSFYSFSSISYLFFPCAPSLFYTAFFLIYQTSPNPTVWYSLSVSFLTLQMPLYFLQRIPPLTGIR